MLESLKIFSLEMINHIVSLVKSLYEVVSKDIVSLATAIAIPVLIFLAIIALLDDPSL